MGLSIRYANMSYKTLPHDFNGQTTVKTIFNEIIPSVEYGEIFSPIRLNDLENIPINTVVGMHQASPIIRFF